MYVAHLTLLRSLVTVKVRWRGCYAEIECDNNSFAIFLVKNPIVFSYAWLVSEVTLNINHYYHQVHIYVGNKSAQAPPPSLRGVKWHEVCVCVCVQVWCNQSVQHGKIEDENFCLLQIYNCLVILLCIKFHIGNGGHATERRRKKNTTLLYKASFGSFILPFILFTFRIVKSAHCRRKQ